MEPTYKIEVIGAKRKLPIRAVIDTGFSGELCIPVDDAIRLGLELVGKDEVEYADGRREQELFFKGAVRILGEVKDVKIFLTESQDSLIGTDLLEDCQLVIDFPKGDVQLTRPGMKTTKRER